MADTPTRATADRKRLFGATPGGWEQEPGNAAQVENPWMEKRGSTYYLFYSGGYYRASYGMGYATASTPTGDTAHPAFAKSALNPILSETAEVLSPGGGSVDHRSRRRQLARLPRSGRRLHTAAHPADRPHLLV